MSPVGIPYSPALPTVSGADSTIGGISPELGPDEILALAHDVLAGQSAQMRGIYAEMRTSQSRGQDLSQLLDAFNAMHATANGTDSTSCKMTNSEVAAAGYSDLLAAAGSGSALDAINKDKRFDGLSASTKQSLNDLLVQMAKNNTTDGYAANTGNVDNLLHSIQNDLQSLNSGSDLQMMQLQTNMQRITTSLTSFTQLLQGLGDTAKSVAGNIGR
jgi:hypothetical protein